MLLIGLLSMPAFAAEVTLCGEALQCTCITWMSAGSATVEVRCPSGASTGGTPTQGTIPSTWGGTGVPAAPATTAPGTPLTGVLDVTVGEAVDAAWLKLRGEWDPELRRYTDNECTNLFDGSRLRYSGMALLTSYVMFRDGTNVQDASGQTPCNANTLAWTRCCSHSPYVFICNAFASAPADRRTSTIIHELMHVGGQREDGNATVGAGDPPNSGNITNAVNEACGLRY